MSGKGGARLLGGLARLEPTAAGRAKAPNSSAGAEFPPTPLSSARLQLQLLDSTTRETFHRSTPNLVREEDERRTHTRAHTKRLFPQEFAIDAHQSELPMLQQDSLFHALFYHIKAES